MEDSTGAVQAAVGKLAAMQMVAVFGQRLPAGSAAYRFYTVQSSAGALRRKNWISPY
jgi:hypothetical protein